METKLYIVDISNLVIFLRVLSKNNLMDSIFRIYQDERNYNNQLILRLTLSEMGRVKSLTKVWYGKTVTISHTTLSTLQ